MKTFFIIFLIASAILFFPTNILAGGLRPPTGLRLDRIECGEYPKALAYFSWDPFEFATSYRFYSKIADGIDNYRAYDETTNPSYTLGFNPQFDFYIGVSSVNTFTGNPPSVSESEKTEYFLSAGKALDICAAKVGESLPPPIIEEMPVPIDEANLSSSDKKDLEVADMKVKELENKINSLEGRIEKVRERQNILERLINKILSFFNIR